MQAQAQPTGVMDIVTVCSQKTRGVEAVDFDFVIEKRDSLTDLGDPSARFGASDLTTSSQFL